MVEVQLIHLTTLFWYYFIVITVIYILWPFSRLRGVAGIHLMAACQSRGSNAFSLVQPLILRSSIRTSSPHVLVGPQLFCRVHSCLYIFSPSCPLSSSPHAYTTSSFLYALYHQYIQCPVSLSVLYKIYPSVSHRTFISPYSFQVDQGSVWLPSCLQSGNFIAAFVASVYPSLSTICAMVFFLTSFLCQ